ncbi:hypothetical protein TBR22_A14420 [Luteitalea sp. TBR-22]|uniref:LPS assembly lipoprotein LptE n=1 Tax=Luteitalea sp. TBR-22 TaxID=2802971 RepID=UPI001AF438AB|nr:LPS assembly lipoprotein LptE [Luteitalea sp. TBR-22]BCS32232.1 hypothetical protein TBR22_A14420 [Luteitalea sp. TBR-22]
MPHHSRPTRSFAIVAVAAIALLAGARVAAQPPVKSFDVPLEWTPREVPAVPVVDLTGGLERLRVVPLADAREDRTSIGDVTGRNTRVVTGTDVAAFVDQHLRRELASGGLDLVTEDADLTLTGELTQFWIDDGETYTGTVRVRLRLTNREGAEVWAALATGRGENWGRRMRRLNYTETITSAILDLASNVLTNAQFMNAIRKVPTGTTRPGG